MVREKLHGRTAQGTWVQLEKTPAAFGQKKLPSLDDLRHLMDYVVYRITRSNVGPWGLSRMTERHPLYLSPAMAMPTPLSPPVAESLAAALHRIEAGGRRHGGVRGPGGPVPAARPGGPRRRAGAGAARPGRARPVRELRRVGHRDAVPGRGRDPEPRPERPPGDWATGRSHERSRSAPAAGTGRARQPCRRDSSRRWSTWSAPGRCCSGAYTIAELTAVDAIVDFLEARPSDEVLAEAVRSLAARQLLVAGAGWGAGPGPGRPGHRGRVPAAGPGGAGRPGHRDRAR